MRCSSKTLPSFDKRDEILQTIKEAQVTVISGETGCGKTTQVPQFILDSAIESGAGAGCRIVCTQVMHCNCTFYLTAMQPRRISAVSVAQRVAAERAEKCGESTGYQVFEFIVWHLTATLDSSGHQAASRLCLDHILYYRNPAAPACFVSCA